MNNRVVETTSGRVQGIDLDGVRAYRGVPFASPPQGGLRFRPPQPVKPWSGIRAADRFADAAWQMPNPLMASEAISDDCLYLNVWVPEGDGPFPVMVWIHGGSYTSGSPSQVLYNGAELARRNQVVVVNLSYRLGAWGYGWFRDLLPDLGESGNLGLQDQLAGLRWVSDNIAGFAGDPGRVTVFGESAGGFSVATLMACPQAQGLFQSAIVQSGAGDFVMSPAQASRVAQRVLDELPGSGSALDRLLAADMKALVRAQNRAARQVVERGLRTNTPQFGMTFMPVVDGDLLPRLPVDAVAAGASRTVRLMAGVCRDEWNLFQYAPPFNGNVPLETFRAMPREEILRRLTRNLPGNGEAALAHYENEIEVHPRRGLMDYFSAMETERTFTVPTVRLLDAQVGAGGQAWGFRFSHEIDSFGVPLGACHVSDVPFVFGLADTPAGRLFTGGGAPAVEIERRVMAAWGAFAHGETPGWDDWASDRQANNFGGREARVALLSASGERFWNGIIPAPGVGADKEAAS